MVKLAFFMLRKGICKKKILLSLNLKMARRKITFTTIKVATASKGGATRPSNVHYSPTNTPQEYYFSCNSTPLYHQNFTNKKNNKFIDTSSYEAVNKVIETMLSTKEGGVRQLRITDSPYPLQNEEVCDHHVDQAAEDFIKRFYSKLEKEQDC